jgi:hypothetical protein
MNPKSENQIEGFFLEFSGEEIADVRKELDLRGYSPDGRGMKEILMDILFSDPPEKENETERFVRKTRDFLKEHPETLTVGVNLAKNLLNRMSRK